MQVLRNGLVLLGLPTYWQVVAIGVVIIAAIALDRWRASRA
jgi:ribose transport system permease protein